MSVQAVLMGLAVALQGAPAAPPAQVQLIDGLYARAAAPSRARPSR